MSRSKSNENGYKYNKNMSYLIQYGEQEKLVEAPTFKSIPKSIKGIVWN